ncbi:MAG: phosphatase PAP2 family protein, partial [Flavobacteriaceae bacterium]
DQLLQLDNELFLFLNNLGTPTWYGFWMFMTQKLNSIPLYAALLWVSFKQLGPKKTLLMLVTVALLVLATDQLTNFFKHGIARLRPCYDVSVNQVMRLVKDGCGGRYGYFSGHSSNSFAVAVFFISLLRPKKIWLPVLLVWASLVAYSRIYIGVHFPLDVVTGIMAGSFFGWLFAKLYVLMAHKFDL